MFVTYSPEDGEPRIWEFLPGQVRVSEQIIVEKQFRGTWLEFKTGIMSGDAAARQVLLWHLLRREHPAIPFRDVPDFLDDELVLSQSLAEVTKSYDLWVSSGGPAGEDGAMLEAMFAATIAEAREREGEPAGKAPSKSAPGPTSGTSPRRSASPRGTSASD